LAFSHITPKNVFQRWADAKQYTDRLTNPFPEFMRIARNEPYPGIDPDYPNVTDGSTASIIQKTPKRVVQQLPTGHVITDDHNWLGIVADFIYNKRIIPYANEDFSLYEKALLIIESGLTYGNGVSYAPFIDHDGYLCPDLTLPYWGDVYIQRGKKSGRSCSFLFLRSWWQPEDIEALIDSESSRSSQSKGYQPTWDTAALKKVKDYQSSKDQQAMTPEETARGVDVTAIELVTAFQKGVGGKFYTFHPGSKTIVRTKVNKDPRGKMPLDWFYGDIDGTNALGRGIVELIGGLQNLIDSDMQAYQFNRALALQPPVIKYGNIGNFSFKPNEVLDARNDMNAKIVPLEVDTKALEKYPELYGLQKSQLLNLVNSPDTSISAQIGNPSFSKTPKGVEAQQAVISVDDNAIRKRFETWFEAWSETAINLYFGERTGKEELQLDKETAMKLRELPNFDPTLLSEDNKIIIDYDTATPALKFRVDPSTTAIADKATQVQNATGLLDLVMKYPMLNANFGGPIEVDVLARRIVVNSGIDDPEQVAPEPTEAQKQSKEMQKQQVNPFSPMFDKPSIRIDYGDVEDPQSRAELLKLAGAPPSQPLAPMSPRVAETAARGVGQILPEETPAQPDPNQPDPNVMTPDHVLKAQDQTHKQAIDEAKLALEAKKVDIQAQDSQTRAKMAANPAQPGAKPAAQPQAQTGPAGEPQLVTHLRQLGLSEPAIQQVVSHALSHQGGGRG
jgi:hypothetical protein